MLTLLVAVVALAAAAPFGAHNTNRLPPCAKVEANLSPETFSREFVRPQRPVVLRGAATEWPAMTEWRSDEALQSRFGRELIEAEEPGEAAVQVTLAEFLKVYNNSDVYLVSSLPHAMREDALLPRCLRRGGVSDALDDTLLWMSAGGTQSQL
jgi:hypothetical protein